MSAPTSLASLKAAAPVVLPSLLLCNFGHLADEVARLEAAGVRALHLDVMDGQFVPNLTYGLPIVEAVRRASDLPIDCHLMIHRPERYVRAFRDAGADVITIHAEATDDLPGTLEAIHASGAAAGVAINPGTSVAAIEPVLSACQLVLVMSVEAGFGGQAFNPVALEKLTRLRTLVSPETVLEVDGGVNAQTISRCAQAGAEWFVVGSAIFRSNDYARSVAELEQLASTSS
ncbi:MAG: ribulose-phosphate 3-epimerase [Planctomycetota bacterium]|nr:MAG: ribulose-phosphate 3-epimerase [Planctomycetota bacterium]